MNHRRFFTYAVTQDSLKVDDEKNFHGILTLENFDINTSVFPTLQSWLTSNLQLSPNPGGSIVFETIEVPRTPIAGNTIPLPFKLQLSSNLLSDSTPEVRFSSYSILDTLSMNLNIVEMFSNPYYLSLKVCDPLT